MVQQKDASKEKMVKLFSLLFIFGMSGVVVRS